MDIIRDPTQSETQGDVTDETSKAFIPLVTTEGKTLTAQDRFEVRLADEEQKCIKKGLPFAKAVARADLQDIQDRVNREIKRQGYIGDIKIPTLNEIDWSKYSNLKNFEVIDEGVQADDHLSRIHRLPVFVKYKKYKYKGFSETYTVMEPREDAVKRAQESIDQRKPIEGMK